jgi:sarcosine oxidase subunit beta
VVVGAAQSAVVVGAGVVGCSVALALAREGLQVTIVDRAAGPGLGSTSASSAIVRFHYSTFEGVALAWEAKHCWERWEAHLGVADEAGMARYVQTGALVLETPGFDVERVFAHYDTLGIPYERVSATAIRDRFPYVAPDRFFPPRCPDDTHFWDDPDGEIGGFYTAEGGFVDDPGLATHNIWTAATAEGVTSVFRAKVAAVLRTGAGVAGVALTDGRQLDAAIVVNAAGPHSAVLNQLAQVLDDFRVSTRPMRQEVHAVAGPPELGGELGPTVGDGDLGTYFRFLPGGDVLVGSQEPECDPLEWLDDPDDCDTRPTAAWFERQCLRLGRRLPSITMPNRPTGLGAVYDVATDWIPIYDKTSLPGYFVAIGTSGNQFKNAPVIGSVLTALVTDWMAGGDHDTRPVSWEGPHTGAVLDLSHYSRRRLPHRASSNSVLG